MEGKGRASEIVRVTAKAECVIMEAKGEAKRRNRKRKVNVEKSESDCEK